jgi:hypothetical protein
VPLAVKLAVPPSPIDAVPGVTVRVVRVGGGVVAVTVMVAAGEVTPPSEAVMELVPALNAVATPATTVATAVLLDTQVTEEVRLAVEASEDVPVAVKAQVVPWTRSQEGGVMAMEVSTGAGGGGGVVGGPLPGPVQATRRARPEAESRRTQRAVLEAAM